MHAVNSLKKLSTSCVQYSDQDYWNERYAKSGGASFDWYQRYDTLKHVINPVIPKDVSVLQVSHALHKSRITKTPQPTQAAFLPIFL